MNAEKKAVAISSMFASALMTVAKLIVGLMTGSLGLVAEAVHSFLDFGATVLTYMAVRVSDNVADDDHHYGHGKIESIAALAETVLLFITCFWIIYEASHRLMSGKIEVEATWLSVAVILASIAIDISRARALKRVAEKTRSQALEADALHFSSDVLSSTVVLIGLGFVAMGWPMGDPIAAIGVSFFVCHAGWVLGRRTVDTLIDAVPKGTAERVSSMVAAVEGVAKVDRIRVRPAGSVSFVDADISVGRSLSQGQVTRIRENIIDMMKSEMPEAEVTVVTNPLALDTETVHQRVTAIALNHNVNVHHITPHHSNGRLSVGFDLEIDGHRSLREAHAIASLLEADIRVEFGHDAEVETHIEPLHDRCINGEDVDPSELQKISDILDALIKQTTTLNNLHKLRARRTENGLIIIFHCRTSPERTVTEVHKAMCDLEHQLQMSYPNIWRILAHAEPEKEGS